MNQLNLMPGAEPFLLPGGPAGCLLIHGFTASPQEMRGLGQALAAAGHTVLAPRLAHHGTDPADMNRSRWHDWYLSALDGWYLLQGLCEKVVVVGLSMGGLTALLLAARLPVAGVVAMSVPMLLHADWRMRFVRPLGLVKPYFEKADWEAQAERGRVAYPVSPTLAVGEIAAYVELVDKALLAVTAPVLLIHDKEDPTAPPESMPHIYRRIGSLHKEMVWLESGVHVITDGPDREAVLARVVGFVEERGGEGKRGKGGGGGGGGGGEVGLTGWRVRAGFRGLEPNALYGGRHLGGRGRSRFRRPGRGRSPLPEPAHGSDRAPPPRSHVGRPGPDVPGAYSGPSGHAADSRAIRPVWPQSRRFLPARRSDPGSQVSSPAAAAGRRPLRWVR